MTFSFREVVSWLVIPILTIKMTLLEIEIHSDELELLQQVANVTGTYWL
jgi:hypothetical protein